MPLHLDQAIGRVTADCGAWTYLVASAIVSCEAGLVVTPSVPGASVLCAAGAIAARGDISVALVILALGPAALCGDNATYCIGQVLGARMVRNERSKVVDRRNLARTARVFGKVR